MTVRGGGPTRWVAAAGLALALVTGCAPSAPLGAPDPEPTTPQPALTPSARAATGESPSSGASRGYAPASLDIPAIQVRSTVVPVGADERILRIPPQPWVVGWWRDGVGAGASTGTTVLTAHLDSRRYGTGPFVRLVTLHRGDPMVVTDVDGGQHGYVVESVDTYRKAALPYASVFSQQGPGRAVLVTCGGSYRRDAGGWDSNVVVTFVPA